jgi:hypothetical protein
MSLVGASVARPNMARDEWFICSVGVLVLITATAVAVISAFPLL